MDNKIYGLFINREFQNQGTLEEMHNKVLDFENELKATYGSNEVEVVALEVVEDVYNKIIRVEMERRVKHYDIMILEKTI